MKEMVILREGLETGKNITEDWTAPLIETLESCAQLHVRIWVMSRLQLCSLQ